ncbi:hypothetical protein ACVDG3_01155 [Meridianimarinicoccus sp. RP-17]
MTLSLPDLNAGCPCAAMGGSRRDSASRADILHTIALISAAPDGRLTGQVIYRFRRAGGDAGGMG